MSDWQDSLDHISSKSLLISTPYQTLIRFYCPIPAICVSPIAGIRKGDWVSVEGIHQHKNQLLYLIDGLKLPHSYFTLNI
jgi:hypothetical protein